MQDDRLLHVAGQDGKLAVFNLASGDVEATYEFGRITAIDCMSGAILVGQRDGTITFLNTGERKNIMHSHSEGELWGLNQSPCNENTIITSGDDNKVMFWDPLHRKL